MRPATVTTRPSDVVLVEDDVTTAMLTIALLEQDGASVRHFLTAEDARAHLEVEPLPDVVLTDLHLPGDSGLDLTRWLRSDPDRATMPIVLVTIAGEREVRLRALDEGADDLLTKPVQPVELRARVRSLTRLARARTQLDVRERLDAVVSRVSDGVVVLDGDGQVRNVNPRATELLALTPAAQGGAPSFLDHVRQGFEVVRESAADGSEDHTIELHRPRVLSEQPLWLLLTLLPIPHDPDGGRVVVVRDVTDERAATALADVVLSSVAHKLRTPLTGIVSAVLMLQKALADSPYAPIIDMVDRNAARLDESLVRILDHAAVVSEGAAASVLTLAQATATDDLTAQLGARAAESVAAGSVELHETVDVPLTPVVTAIEEFVTNAIENGDPAPRVRVRLEAGELVVAVEDEGPGFPPEDADRLFSPFFQVDRTGQAPGMGLGLPLVHHLVTRAGGRTKASCPPGGPTCFEARFPVTMVAPSVGGTVTTEAA